MIFVVGATGRLGGLIARRLLTQGEQVRVLVRHNSPSEALAQQGGPLRLSRFSRRGRSRLTVT